MGSFPFLSTSQGGIIMSGDKEKLDKSLDPAVRQMIAKAEQMDVTTVWDRYAAMTPQCGFGDTGLCCRHCLQGPGRGG